MQLVAENGRYRFIQETSRDVEVAAVALDGFSVRTAKMRPLIQ